MPQGLERHGHHDHGRPCRGVPEEGHARAAVRRGRGFCRRMEGGLPRRDAGTVPGGTAGWGAQLRLLGEVYASILQLHDLSGPYRLHSRLFLLSLHLLHLLPGAEQPRVLPVVQRHGHLPLTKTSARHPDHCVQQLRLGMDAKPALLFPLLNNHHVRIHDDSNKHVHQHNGHKNHVGSEPEGSKCDVDRHLAAHPEGPKFHGQPLEVPHERAETGLATGPQRLEIFCGAAKEDLP
mmetsp:Transcript_27112/g.70257  ORF Transcript_27112/g.70257 Transcript_27112/m.70257 type:complete len:235 (-) Transcript_27112:993-1697(-)